MARSMATGIQRDRMALGPSFYSLGNQGVINVVRKHSSGAREGRDRRASTARACPEISWPSTQM